LESFSSFSPPSVQRFFSFGHVSCSYCSENTFPFIETNDEDTSAAISDSIYKISFIGALPDIWLINADFFNLVREDIDNTTNWNLIKSVTGLSCISWDVPVVTQNKKQCFAKVIGYYASGAMITEDTSDKKFTIEVLRVTTPDGGEVLRPGSKWSIRWVSHETIRPVAKTVLQYTTDGNTWTRIKTLTGNPGSYNWTVPAVSSTKCKVKVILKDAGGTKVGTDVSNKNFTIGP
jgi:hypothetical protein